MSENRTAADVARSVLWAIQAGDWDAVRGFCAADYTHHAPGVPVADLDTYIATLQIARTALPDMRIEIEDIIPAAPHVTMRYMVHGHLHAPFHGIAPTGAAIALPTLGLLRLDDQLAAEGWYAFDSAEISRQSRQGKETPA